MIIYLYYFQLDSQFERTIISSYTFIPVSTSAVCFFLRTWAPLISTALLIFGFALDKNHATNVFIQPKLLRVRSEILF